MLADRRRLLIGLGLVVMLGVAAWRYLASGGMAPATTPARGGTARRPAQVAAAEPLPPAEEVRLAFLQLERDEPSAATRNPFKFDRRTGAAAPPSEPVASFTPVAPAELEVTDTPAFPPQRAEARRRRALP